MNFTTKAIVLDTETTGLKAPEPIEIAYLELPDLAEIGLKLLSNLLDFPTKQQRFKPQKPIESGASQIHGIYMKDVIREPGYSAELFNAEIPLTTEYLIGHNINYDLRTLRCTAGGATSEHFQFVPICTLKLAKQLWPELPSRSLSNLIDAFYPAIGKTLRSKAHGALADCYLTAIILNAAIEEYLPADWEELAMIADPKR